MPRNRTAKNETANKIFLLLLVLFLNIVVYKLVQILVPSGISLSTQIDSAIPFVQYFVVPYYLYPVFLLLPFVLFWKDYRSYRTMALSLITVLIISNAIYFAFQTEVSRPDIQTTDVFSKAVLAIYSADNPVNAFPSLHVAVPTIFTFFIFARSRKLGLCLLPITILIILSTLFIKQHVIADVVGGLLLAFVVFRYRKIFK